MAAIKNVNVKTKLVNGFKIQVEAGNHTFFIDQPCLGS